MRRSTSNQNNSNWLGNSSRRVVACLLMGIVSVGLPNLSAAQSATPAAPAEQTFFGHTIGQTIPGEGTNVCCSSLDFGNKKLWYMETSIEEDKVPRFLRGNVGLKTLTTSDGKLQLAVFRLNPFKSDEEIISSAPRKQRFNELVGMLNEKFGVKPTERMAMGQKITIPLRNGKAEVFDAEYVLWTRPWGTATLMNCEYQPQPGTCPATGYMPTLLVQSNAMIELKKIVVEQRKKSEAANNASRAKL